MIHAPILYYNEEAERYLNELASHIKFSQLFVLTDENTSRYCLPLCETFLGHQTFTEIQIKSGESNKTLNSCSLIWSSLTQHKADRNALVLLLGGGVLTDMGAFAASCYKRGIRFINIPTTLLAMVDASTGSKTGIDFEGLKNHIGLFSSPLATLVHQAFLPTLDQREFKSGVCEMLKHGLIANALHWKNLVAHLEHPEPFIADSVNIKIAVVSEDPTEQGMRKILNFGHTFGHAIETSFLNSSAPLLHGEAIAAGIILESYLSSAYGSLGEKDNELIAKTLVNYYMLPQLSQTIQEEVIALMAHDKKNHKAEINFVALTEIGRAIYDVNYSDEALRQAFDYYNRITYR